MCGTYVEPKLYAIELSYGNEIYHRAYRVNHISRRTTTATAEHAASRVIVGGRTASSAKVAILRNRLNNFLVIADTRHHRSPRMKRVTRLLHAKRHFDPISRAIA